MERHNLLPRIDPLRLSYYDRIAGQLQIQLTQGNWEAAHRIIDRTEHQQTPFDVPADPLTIPVSDIGLTHVTLKRLHAAHIHTVGDLLRCTRRQLLSIPRVGKTRLAEVMARLADLGIHSMIAVKADKSCA